MQPKTFTTLGELRTGDRFYIRTDKNKTVYEVARTGHHLNVVEINVPHMGNYLYRRNLERKTTCAVCFLRHTQLTDIGDPAITLPNGA